MEMVVHVRQKNSDTVEGTYGGGRFLKHALDTNKNLWKF